MNKVKNLLLVGLMVMSVSLAGCSKKSDVKPDEGITSGDVGSGNMDGMGATDSDSGNAMGLETVHFPYDSFEIVGENREILKNNIRIMKDNPTLNIQIEGHCDERGGIQYNLALGEKRANAVKQQVLAGGVAGSRVNTISMGKEKPIAPGSGEEAWAKNRRANFAITSK
ncbi:MAG: OmpA family protein [Bacteriovoracia bacterium]